MKPHLLATDCPLLDILEVKAIGENHFQARNHDIGVQHLFGGQLLAQGLMAAYESIDNHQRAHSLHAYYLKMGRMDLIPEYRVQVLRNGHGFSSRQVSAYQGEHLIFTLMASFQKDEQGLEHQHRQPISNQNPDELLSDRERRQQLLDYVPENLKSLYLKTLPVCIHPVDPINPFEPEKKKPTKQIWLKSKEKLPDDIKYHHTAFAYMSDYGLISTALLPHGVSYLQSNMKVASLDHCLWFYHQTRADSWFLHELQSDIAASSRGHSTGHLYTQDHKLFALSAQDGLMRKR